MEEGRSVEKGTAHSAMRAVSTPLPPGAPRKPKILDFPDQPNAATQLSHYQRNSMRGTYERGAFIPPTPIFEGDLESSRRSRGRSSLSDDSQTLQPYRKRQATERPGMILLKPEPVVTVILISPIPNNPSDDDTISPLQPEQLPAITYTVHKSLICARSPFFAAAFNSTFTEGLTQSITFSDICPAHFGIFNSWLYFQKIQLQSKNYKGGCDILQLGHLWLLGQRFMAPEFQNAVMDKIISGWNEKPSATNLHAFMLLAYEGEDGRETLRNVGIYQLSYMGQDWMSQVLGGEMALAWRDLAFEFHAKQTRTCVNFHVSEDVFGANSAF